MLNLEPAGFPPKTLSDPGFTFPRVKFSVSTLVHLFLASQAKAAISTLQVQSVVREIIDTGASATAVVNPGGSVNNTRVWNVGDSARFIMTGDDGTGHAIQAGMEVAPTAGTGYAAPGTDSLMIARTVKI